MKCDLEYGNARRIVSVICKLWPNVPAYFLNGLAEYWEMPSKQRDEIQFLSELIEVRNGMP